MNAKPTKHGSGWRIRWWDETGQRQSTTIHSDFKSACLILRQKENEAEEIKRGLRAPAVISKTFDDDGFIHPKFHQLQAKTGRITTTRPSPFDKLLRPIIVPTRPGYGIFEMDIGQAEVWLIACMSGDRALQLACESYDVYLRLGVDIVRAQFSDEDAELIKRGPKNQTEREKLEHFKDHKYRDLRNKLLKALVLAIIYGQTPKSVAKKTKQKISFINAIFEQLEVTYPDLFRFINANVKYGSQRGYIELRGGFRIHVSGADNEINRHRNNPIQGMCAVLFNRALLYAYEAIPRFGGRILFPLYDAIVVEAPLLQFENCQRTMREIFTNVFQSAFPEATAIIKLDVNDKEPSCWNDHGATDSLNNIPVRVENGASAIATQTQYIGPSL